MLQFRNKHNLSSQVQPPDGHAVNHGARGLVGGDHPQGGRLQHGRGALRAPHPPPAPAGAVRPRDRRGVLAHVAPAQAHIEHLISGCLFYWHEFRRPNCVSVAMK